MPDNFDLDTMNRLINLGGKMSDLKPKPGGGFLAVVPEGFRLQAVEDMDVAPIITRRAPRFFETGSFVNYVTAFKVQDRTRIFVNPESSSACAVIDYDAPGAPDRGVHRAHLALTLSPEWQAWQQAAAITKSRGFTQEEFAEFLEEHDVDVAAPTSAELVELVTNMQITKNVSYKRSVRLQDGTQQFSYINDNEAGAQKFPSQLVLGIPVFKGGERYRVTVLIRYRLQDGGSLRFALVIHRAEEIVHDALQGDIAAIQEATGVPVHIGSVV
jgi:uncharacterized protein YfdQ (DUF2303 family)